MNELIYPNDVPEVPWVTSGHRMPVPDTSMLPGTEKLPTAAVASLSGAVHAAHDALDRFADGAAPRARQLGESLARGEAALRRKADQLGRTRDEWAEGLRGTVRSHPLAAVAVAVALGAVIVRVTRELRASRTA